MEKLRQYLASKLIAAFGVAVLIGIVLSYLHDIVQLALIPLGEWARITFIVNTSNEFVATNLVNFFFQIATFSIAYAFALALMGMLIPIKTMRYPSIAFSTYLLINLWWIPLSFVVDFPPAFKIVLPLVPTLVFASVLVFWVLTKVVVRRYGTAHV